LKVFRLRRRGLAGVLLALQIPDILTAGGSTRGVRANVTGRAKVALGTGLARRCGRGFGQLVNAACARACSCASESWDVERSSVMPSDPGVDHNAYWPQTANLTSYYDNKCECPLPRPQPEAQGPLMGLRMMGRTARVTFIGPCRLVPSCRSNGSSVSSSKYPA